MGFDVNLARRMTTAQPVDTRPATSRISKATANFNYARAGNPRPGWRLFTGREHWAASIWPPCIVGETVRTSALRASACLVMDELP